MWTMECVNRFGEQEYVPSKNTNWRVLWHPEKQTARIIYDTCRGWERVNKTKRIYHVQSDTSTELEQVPKYIAAFVKDLFLLHQEEAEFDEH
jgi:hypothetical protein